MCTVCHGYGILLLHGHQLRKVVYRCSCIDLFSHFLLFKSVKERMLLVKTLRVFILLCMAVNFLRHQTNCTVSPYCMNVFIALT